MALDPLRAALSNRSHFSRLVHRLDEPRFWHFDCWQDPAPTIIHSRSAHEDKHCCKGEVGTIGKFAAEASTQPRTDCGHGRPGQPKKWGHEENDNGVKPAQNRTHRRHEVHIAKPHGFAAKAQRPQNPHTPN
jgi:hypothetical protein